MTNDIKRDLGQIALNRRQLLQAAGAGAAAAAFSGIGAPAMAQEKVELTMWAWTPNTQAEIDLFTKAFPHISVKLFPGRSEAVKQRLADAIVKDVVDIVGCDEASVSVTIEDVSTGAWKEKVFDPDIRAKKDLLYKKPGYSM